MYVMNDREKDALERLIKHAKRDSGQSRKIADFLLAWWNADTCGRFDFRDTWACDTEIVDDIVVVFNMIVRSNTYPDTLGYAEEFKYLAYNWRSN